MGMHGTFGMHDVWGYWWLFMFFWWFGGARLLSAAARGIRRGQGTLRREDPALITLRERFARGEIDRAEYEERRAILKGKTSPVAPAAQRGDGPSWPDLP
jgi:uncharacterized membrane protein